MATIICDIYGIKNKRYTIEDCKKELERLQKIHDNENEKYTDSKRRYDRQRKINKLKEEIERLEKK